MLSPQIGKRFPIPIYYYTRDAEQMVVLASGDICYSPVHVIHLYGNRLCKLVLIVGQKLIRFQRVQFPPPPDISLPAYLKSIDLSNCNSLTASQHWNHNANIAISAFTNFYAHLTIGLFIRRENTRDATFYRSHELDIFLPF